MEWQSPWAFLFIPVVIGAVIFYFWRRQQNRSTLKFSDLLAVRAVTRGLRAHLAEAPILLKTLALLLVIVALARPQQPNTKIKRDVEGIDIVVTLDISDSMLIEDAGEGNRREPLNRMDASKKTIAEFIKGRVSDRIGLVVFSGEAYTRVPLTLDYPLLLENVKSVAPSRNIKMGTAIGVALANATLRLKESLAKSRVIIFLTDGENNSGTIDPDTALDMAKGYGFRIYSIGMGRDGQAQLPQMVPDGRGNFVKQYRPMHSKINEELLRKFADATGGKFWRAESGNQLDQVFREIDSLEKTKISENKFTKYSEMFQRYLWWALVFYFLSVVLGHSWLRRGP